MQATTMTTRPTAVPSLIRWGAVLAGVVLGLSLLILLTSLWAALAYGSGMTTIADNIEWYVAVSGVVSMLVGGTLAGWLSGIPGGAPGLFNGFAVWGLILIGSIVIGLPAVAATLTVNPQVAFGGTPQSASVWAPFVALLVGALAAGLGGLLGGKTTRPASSYANDSAVPTHAHRADELRVEPHDDTHRPTTSAHHA